METKPPIIAFKSKELTQLAILKNKPFKCPKRIAIISQKKSNDKTYFFNVPEDSWCVSVDLLKEKESCHGYSIYIIDPSPASKNIVIPINKLILPGPNAPELEQYYGYFEFIKYEKKNYMIDNRRQVDIENFKIKRDVLVRLEN